MKIDNVWMLLLLVYLCFQAVSDARTGMVYSFWNNASTIASSVLAVVYLLVRRDSISVLFLIDTLMVFAGCLILCRDFRGKKIMQPADAKAIWQIFCISFVALGYGFALYTTAFSVLLSTTSFMIYYRLIKKTQMCERKPYFPFLAFGYSFVAFVFWALNGV